MDMNNFTVWHGILVSLFIMLIVFLILYLLAVILGSLKYIVKGPETTEKQEPTLPTATSYTDAEEKMVAMLTAACVAKQELKKDVQIVSCKRIN